MHTEEAAAPSTLERLLGLERQQGQPLRRSWWRIRRSGSTRFLIPTHQPGVRTALEMVNSRWNYWGLRVGLRMARFTGQPEVVGSALDPGPLDELMATILPGQELYYAVYCGTESIYRKYTVQCQDATGRSLAYVKLSQGPRAGKSLLNEAAVLQRLGSSPRLRASVPRVLELTERWGCRILVVSSFEARYSRAPSVPTDAIGAYLARLFSVERVSRGWAESPSRARAIASAERLERAGESGASSLLRQAVSVLDHGFQETALPHGRAHGDFLPWNVRLAPEPRVFDWEWSRSALPFHDLYHYLTFSRLGSRRGRSMRDLHLLRRAPRVRRLLHAASPGALPFANDDLRWWQAYVTDAFAFYAESASASGQALPDTGLIGNLSALLRLAIDRDR